MLYYIVDFTVFGNAEEFFYTQSYAFLTRPSACSWTLIIMDTQCLICTRHGNGSRNYIQKCMTSTGNLCIIICKFGF